MFVLPPCISKGSVHSIDFFSMESRHTLVSLPNEIFQSLLVDKNAVWSNRRTWRGGPAGGVSPVVFTRVRVGHDRSGRCKGGYLERLSGGDH